MKFLNFKTKNLKGIGIKGSNGQIRGLVESDKNYPGSLESLVQKEADLKSVYKVLENSKELNPDEISYLPVLENPNKILCIGLNYEDHAKETGLDIPEFPTMFARFSTSLIGHKAPIINPKNTHSTDYEAELAVIIGKKGRHISRKDAPQYILGYSIFNDVSIREVQLRTSQWDLGKNYDSTGPFGPYLVTSEEVPVGGSELKIETRLNGQTVQDSNTKNMIFSVPELIETMSQVMTLLPGDIIITGTPAGIGGTRNPKLFLKEGDLCEVEIEGLGLLKNPVKDEK